MTRSSISSSASVKLLARKAALEVEAVAMKERQDIDQHILQLQQKAKRHDIQTELGKIEAEQRVLDAVSEELEEASEVSEPKD